MEIKTEMDVKCAMANLQDIERWTIVCLDHRRHTCRKFDWIVMRIEVIWSVFMILNKRRCITTVKDLNYYPYQYRFT